jgi:hypothetical protein
MLNQISNRFPVSLFLLSTCLLDLFAQDLPESLPEIKYHLTAHPWHPSGLQPKFYLENILGICQVAGRFQNEEGAIIDPYLEREHQYSTPYYAFAVGTLLHAGVGQELKESGIRAMEHATICYAAGHTGIPDGHGEFFIAPLTESLELYRDHVSQETLGRWRQRLQRPVEKVTLGISKRLNNWRTYSMKGIWLQYQAGLLDRDPAVAFVEDAWLHRTQRQRILNDKWNLYQDWSSDPQSHAVEAVGRGNLTALLMAGYDGPSATEMLNAVRRGAKTALLLQSPDGQCPPNGRTDDHVFNDVLYGLIFEAMAEDAHHNGQFDLAGQYRRAASLALESIQRWRRTDLNWEGSFFITKNYFDPGARIGYQPASQWGNYSGAVMMHLAEAYLIRKSTIDEKPAPTEIGGYAFQTDSRFDTFVANAGGMQVFVNLRGASVPKYNEYWTPLGVVRFSRVAWDARLGPSDGAYRPQTIKQQTYGRGANESPHLYYPGAGVTFGPTWQEEGQQVNLADMHEHYRITPQVTFVHPLLVKFSLTYHYTTGRGGPYFRQYFTVTPDVILTRLVSATDTPVELTVPLLVNDGRALDIQLESGIIRTRYEEKGDEQCFISLNEDAVIDSSGTRIRSTYGWLLPVRIDTDLRENHVLIYPRDSDDPDAQALRESFRLDASGFTSLLTTVSGDLFIGRNAAGGHGDAIDLNGDGIEDVTFSEKCGFVLQLDEARVTKAECDRTVRMQYGGVSYQMNPYFPVQLKKN